MTVSVGDLKDYLTIEHDEDDAMLGLLINASTGMVEDFLNAEIVDADAGTGQILRTDQIDSAIMAGGAYLYENRGENKNSMIQNDSAVIPIIRNMLHGKRVF